MNNTQLLKLLYDEIPLAKAMGVELIGDPFPTLKAPLLLNSNHLNTAFGGSLSALLILSCYAWLFKKMHEEGHECHVLIQEANVEYLLPVREDLIAHCTPPSKDVFEKFTESFKRKGMGRIGLESVIRTKEGDACLLRGVFFAQKGK